MAKHRQRIRMLGTQATAGESELGWEVLRQAAALAASSHGQSSLTTRQLLHGACAGLRSISQDQMDFMVRLAETTFRGSMQMIPLQVFAAHHIDMHSDIQPS